jgi:multisubunit Na+/H+ antiporter MnhG subunit
MIYFNSQSIPELQGLNFSQRMQVIRAAADRLPAPTKITLNIIKLIILSVLFILIARAEGWAIAGYVALLVVLYPLITRPITFYLCRKSFAGIRRQQFPEHAE